MMVIDASVLVSSFLTKDVNHAVSLNWLTQYLLAKKPLIAPILIIPELTGPVMRRDNDPLLAQQSLVALKNMPNFSLVAIDQSLAENAARLAIDLRLRGADAIYVALAQQLNIPLITWDNEQLSRAAGAIQTFTPATAP